MGCDDEKLSKYLTHTFMAHCHTMICQQVTLSGEAEWPKVADAVIEALRLFRKHFYRLLHVFVAATVGFQVQDAVVWVTRMDISPEPIGHIDHEQRQIRRIGDPCRGDVHEVFQAPVLFGVPEVKLDLEPQSIIVYEWRVRQVEITAKQDNMGAGLSAQVRLRDDDGIQRLREPLMEQWHLRDTGRHVPLDRSLFEA